MTTIKATCPTCGEVELTSPDVTLMVCPTTPLSYYSFTCPACLDTVRKPADEHIVSLLISGGVVAKTWNVPAEAFEQHSGLPVSYDDLLDFVLWLGLRDDLAALAETPARR